LRQAAISALPLTLALLLTLGLESDRIAHGLHEQWLARSDEIIAGGDAQACASWITRGTIFTGGLVRLLSDDPERRRDLHQRWARLEQCRGDLEAAAAELNAAVAAAEAVRARYASQSRPEPLPWLASELSLATLLRDGAELENDLGAFRLALATLARAESGLELARNRVETWADAGSRAQATAQLQETEGEIAASRARVRTRMASL
jgi:hypothetical protein